MSKTNFDPSSFEPVWQKKWEEIGLFQDSAHFAGSIKKKLFLLFAFAYPSGSGLHVGHVESKTALDILARYHRMNGRSVYFPVGWDAFGLPAENYAIKTKIPPVETTKNAINTFRRQIKRIGISYDWTNEIATCHPGYYRWTQFLFLKLYEKGLAYKRLAPVNWCPGCKTVLANEQVLQKSQIPNPKSQTEARGICERCETPVIQRELNQWFFKITDYKDELITGLDQVDWPLATKQQQINWIGRSEGANVTFQISTPIKSGSNDKSALDVFTTAHDTIFGCTFMVIAPEHEFLQKNKKLIHNWDEISKYIEQSKLKTERDRQISKEKTGVLVKGIELLNPINGKKVPLFVADYVLVNYGTGAIMAVPGQDERDYEFAQKYNLPVIFTTTLEKFVSYAEIKINRENYFLAHSEEFNGLNYQEGRKAILEKLINLKAGEERNEYKLRDWLISRQRYWGAPIPIVYDPEGIAHPVQEEHLPWILPTDVEFKPTGQSPLTHSKEFIARTEKLYGKGWRPEFDTMDTFVDSSWYFFRYTDSRNEKEFASKEQMKYWLPIDFYMIGAEHIVLHLLYARFFTKFLRDSGFINFGEPFLKMRHQGMILGPDHKKMSKSKGNVIDPDAVIGEYGADTLRMYEMFLGPIEDEKPWNVESVSGVYKFLKRVYELSHSSVIPAAEPESIDMNGSSGPKPGMTTALELKRALHQTIKKVTEDIPNLKFNTAIAAMMTFINRWEEVGVMDVEDLGKFLLILAPFAPFLTEELFQQIVSRHSGLQAGIYTNNWIPDPASQGEQVLDDTQFHSIHTENWPQYDEKYLKSETVSIIVQVNGHLRGNLNISNEQSTNQSAIEELARDNEKIKGWIQNGVKKVIFVPGRLINFVV